MKALGKEKISKKIKKKPLCRAPYSWHLAKTPFAECHAPALGKVFFVFGLQIFCAALLKYQELLVRI